MSKKYHAGEGVLPIGPLDSEVLVFECQEPEGATFEREKVSVKFHSNRVNAQ